LKGSRRATLAAFRKEMARPRVAKSAQRKYANLPSSVRLTEARKPSNREK